MSNKYAKQLLDRAQEQFSIDSTSMSYTDWCCKNTTLRGRPFSVKGFEFQRKIIDDMHPNLSCVKISQVGLTEGQIRKTLAFLKRQKNTTAIYSLPNEEMYTRVSNGRVKTVVNTDPVFNTASDAEHKATRSIGMMQFGGSFLYMVQAIESAATSIPADMLMLDEVDLSDQKILSLFASRLQRSAWKITQRFSTPSFPAFGISMDWDASDQHLYECRCTSCGHWQHPEFTRDFIHCPGLSDNIGSLTEITIAQQDALDFDNAYVKCEKCHNPLDLANPDLRHWSCAYPHRVNSRGYRVGPFSIGDISVKYVFSQLFNYQKTEHIRAFYNTVLGLPYSDGTIQIPVEDIVACFTQVPNEPTHYPTDDIWVGIDMGQTCHITIGRGHDPKNLEIINLYTVHVKEIVEHVKLLRTRYNIRFGCVDRHPYEPTAREIFEASGGKIIPVEYRGQKDMNCVYDPTNTSVVHMQVNPTWFLDNFASLIRKHAIRISGYGFQKQIIIEHFRNMVRDEVPGSPAKWTKLNGNDHYLHSSAFMALAPLAQELIRIKDKTEIRTMDLTAIAHMEGPSKGLGLPKKKLADGPLTV